MCIVCYHRNEIVEHYDYRDSVYTCTLLFFALLLWNASFVCCAVTMFVTHHMYCRTSRRRHRWWSGQPSAPDRRSSTDFYTKGTLCWWCELFLSTVCACARLWCTLRLEYRPSTQHICKTSDARASLTLQIPYMQTCTGHLIAFPRSWDSPDLQETQLRSPRWLDTAWVPSARWSSLSNSPALTLARSRYSVTGTLTSSFVHTKCQHYACKIVWFALA